MENIMKIIKSLEDSGLLLKGVSETIQNKVREQKVGFLYVIRYIRCKFIRKYVNRKRNQQNRRWNNQSWLWIFKKRKFLILPHPFSNFEIQKYFQNEPRFNGVYSRDNLPIKIKDETYVINPDEYADIETQRMLRIQMEIQLPIQATLLLNVFQKKPKVYKQQKHYKKYLQNTST